MRFRQARVLALVALLCLAWSARAQSSISARDRAGSVSTAVSAAKRVPVPPPCDKALRYYRSGNVWWAIDVAWGVLIPSLFLFTGFSARIRNWARKLGRKWFFVIAIYFVAFTLLNSVIDLPLVYMEDFVRQHAYGLSNQIFAKWFADALTNLAVGLVTGVLFLWVPYLLLRTSPRRWWLYAAVLSLPFLVFVTLISPIWIDPLFNKFGPMQDKVLERKILDLADRAAIAGGRVYEVNKSVDTKAINAYVAGFGNTKRIVLWDTIIAKLEEDELLVVMAHEMAHYVLGHVRDVLFFSTILVLVTLYTAWRISDLLIRRFKHRFGFDRLSDIASLPLLLLLVNVFSFMISPVPLAFSRYQEREADRFALEITHSNRAAAMAFVKLQEENLAVPYPGMLYKLWRASHPSVGERIDFCNDYRPWETGQPIKYASYFAAPKP